MAIASKVLQLTRPRTAPRPSEGMALRRAGLVASVVGWAIVLLAFALGLGSSALVAGGASASEVAARQVAAFGLATAGLGIAKTGITLVLWAIVRRLWARFEAIRASLPGLMARRREEGPLTCESRARTRYGIVTVSSVPPRPLLVHRMARAMWLPVLAMGAMAVAAGLAAAGLSSAAYGAGDAAAGTSLRAWTQGLQFLGEGLLLAAISLFLGTILGAIREGGAEVQHAVGVPVVTLAMPLSAKVFLALMATGLMAEVAQLAGYAYAATLDAAGARAAFAYLGPLREAGLGVLLLGITLALATIGHVMRFQFARISRVIRAGE